MTIVSSISHFQLLRRTSFRNIHFFAQISTKLAHLKASPHILPISRPHVKISEIQNFQFVPCYITIETLHLTVYPDYKQSPQNRQKYSNKKWYGLQLTFYYITNNISLSLMHLFDKISCDGCFVTDQFTKSFLWD